MNNFNKILDYVLELISFNKVDYYFYNIDLMKLTHDEVVEDHIDIALIYKPLNNIILVKEDYFKNYMKLADSLKIIIPVKIVKDFKTINSTYIVGMKDKDNVYYLNNKIIPKIIKEDYEITIKYQEKENQYKDKPHILNNFKIQLFILIYINLQIMMFNNCLPLNEEYFIAFLLMLIEQKPQYTRFYQYYLRLKQNRATIKILNYIQQNIQSYFNEDYKKYILLVNYDYNTQITTTKNYKNLTRTDRNPDNRFYVKLYTNDSKYNRYQDTQGFFIYVQFLQQKILYYEKDLKSDNIKLVNKEVVKNEIEKIQNKPTHQYYGIDNFIFKKVAFLKWDLGDYIDFYKKDEYEDDPFIEDDDEDKEPDFSKLEDYLDLIDNDKLVKQYRQTAKDFD